VRRGREAGHVHPDLGDDHGGRGGTDPEDLVQAGHRVSEGGGVGLDLGVEVGDVRVERVDAGEHLGQQESVVVGEVSNERLFQLRDLGAHPGPGHLGQDLGVALPADQGGHHLPAGDPEDVGGDNGQLDLGSSRSFSTRFFSAVHSATSATRYLVRSRSRRIGGGGMKLGRSMGWFCRGLSSWSVSRAAL
jgi:hypothetical protein